MTYPYNEASHLLTDDSLIVYATGENQIGYADWYNITTALNNTPPGGVVRLAGIFYVNQPIVFPPYSVSLQGLTIGPTQGGGGTPGRNSVIKALPGFQQQGAPALAVICAGTGVRQDVSDIWTDCTLALNVTDLEGIDFAANTNGHSIHRVSTYNTPSWGIYCAGSAAGFIGDTVIVQNAGSNTATQHLGSGASGGYFCQMSDAWHINVHTQTVTGNGIVIRSSDHILMGCRADSSTLNGFNIACLDSAPSGVGLGARLIGCATQNNQQVAYLLTTGGNNQLYGPYQLVGCSSSGDGSGGTFAAVQCMGRLTASITDMTVSGDGIHPAYGVATALNSGNAKPDLVSIDGGIYQVGTAVINDAAPAIVTHVGSRVRYFIGAITTGSGNTTWSLARNPANIVTPAVPASGTPQVNNNDRAVTVVVTGGTVTAIVVNGVTTGLTSGPVMVPAGGSITLTYSAAPTWVWF